MPRLPGQRRGKPRLYSQSNSIALENYRRINRIEILLGRGRAIVRTLADRRLLADALRIALAAKFGEKSFFFQSIARPQQFQQRIVRIGCGAAGLA